MGPFIISNAVFVLISLTCCYLAMRVQKPWAVFLLFFWQAAQEFWDGVFHIYDQVQFRAYSPGFFTSVFLYTPLFFYLSYLCLRDRHLSWQLWLIALVTSPTALFMVIWDGLYHFGHIPFEQFIP
jgi:hypothetical protein